MIDPTKVRVWNPANPEHLALMRLRDSQLKGKGMSRVQIQALRAAQQAAPPDNLVDDPSQLKPAALAAQEAAEVAGQLPESAENVSRETLPATAADDLAIRRARTNERKAE